jgi:hypothetical protein
MSAGIAPPQRVSPEQLLRWSEKGFEVIGEFVEVKTSILLDMLMDLNDLRVAFGLDSTRAERFESHLERLREEFLDADGTLRNRSETAADLQQ